MVHNSQASIYAPEITVVISTDRKNSNTMVVSKELLKHLAQNPNARINVVDLAKLPQSMFKADYFEKKSPFFENNFVKPIVNTDGIIFVIPEYDGAVPGILSYYMNHMRASLSKKQIALVGISAGRWGARSPLDAFKGTLTHRGGRVLGDIQVNIEFVESKVEQSQLTNPDAKSRLGMLATELTKSLNLSPGAIPTQKNLGMIAAGAKDKKAQVLLNNSNAVEGVFSNYVLNDNGTLSYVQFSGPTKIKNKDVIIPGQDVNVHDLGYGMPVGAIKGFKKEWYKKPNIESTGLKIGERVKLEYESGIVVNGQLKNMTFDTDGNLLVLTFSDVTVKNGSNFLFQKDWGDFDIAVADYIEQITLQ
ncbi:NAD(P)H-dependent oxidoreductase [bacterium]|nr:NAD(P)H-dependent oxidoreductase [bacterium]